MSKKIYIYFRDEFKEGEFARLSAEVVSTIRVDFPGVIVHTTKQPRYREPFIAYGFGFWLEDEGQTVVDAAGKIITRLMGRGNWRLERYLERLALESPEETSEDDGVLPEAVSSSVEPSNQLSEQEEVE